MLRAIPMLIFVVIAYNVIAFLSLSPFDAKVLGFTLASGRPWTLSLGELLVVLGLALLYLEIVKSTRSSVASIIDHGLSMLLFVICLVEFIVVPQAATGTFFLITLMTLLDVLAGFTVTIVASRRDIEVERI